MRTTKLIIAKMMKKMNFEKMSYEAPRLEVVEINVEKGFELSLGAGFETPSYGEEDVEW